MSEQEVKTLIYNALESGLKPDEIISKHNLSNYKRNVQGCYTWFIKNGSRTKKPELTQTEIYAEKCNNELQELSKAFETIISFIGKLPHINEQMSALDTLLEIPDHKLEEDNLTNEQVLKCYKITSDIRKRRRAVKQIHKVIQIISTGGFVDLGIKATKAKVKIDEIIRVTGEDIANNYEHKATKILNKYQNQFVRDYLKELKSV